MSNFFGNFATLAADPGAEMGGAVEITLKSATWNGSTALNLSGSIASARGKAYYPRVLAFGEVQRGFDVRSSNVSPLEMEISVQDGEQEGYALKAALEGGHQRGSVATVYWVIAGNASDYAVRFGGILDRWAYSQGITTLILRTDDRPLKGYAGWQMLKSDWPNMPTESIGLYAPIVYGVHNSSGLSGTGMLPAPCVAFSAGTLGWYVAAAGEAKLIRDVWKNGTLQTAGGTNYTRSYATTAAGRVYTVVKFTTIPATTDVITVDVDGYETTGNTGSGATFPTGVTILNPVEQIRHFLVNWAELDWTTGAWYTSDNSNLLDKPSWARAAQWAERQQLEGAGYIGGTAETKQVGDVLNEWLATWTCFRAFWTAAGKLGLTVIPLDWQGYRTATSPPLLRTENEQGEGGSFDYQQDTTNLTDSISGSYLYDQVQGQYLGTLTVTNPDLGENVSTNTQLAWSIRRAV